MFPPKLLILGAYVSCVTAMDAARGCSPQIYRHLDLARREIHAALLEACGVSRDDQEFTFELATMLEEALYEKKKQAS